MKNSSAENLDKVFNSPLPKLKVLREVTNKNLKKPEPSKFKKLCKVAILAYLVVWFSFGTPQDVLKGLYQGFVHGWQSDCSDWYTCPEANQP